MLDDHPTILYLINPDPVLYEMMDQLVIDAFKRQNITVITTQLDELSVIISDEIIFHKNGIPIEFNAFLAYGYMAPKHYQDYMYLSFAAYSAGKTILHSPCTESTLQNKLLQYIKFSESQVPFPKCGASFSVSTFKHNLQQFKEKCIMKEVIGYEGTGVKLSNHKNESMELYCKSLWNGEQSIIQEYVDDSVGRSIRVLVIGGRAQSVTEFQDNIDFKSNGFSDDFKIESKMDSDKKQQYFSLAEKACAAIDPHLTIGGVDILDSRKFGMMVLEINSWPEMNFSQDITGLPLFDTFAREFVEKTQNQNKSRSDDLS